MKIRADLVFTRVHVRCDLIENWCQCDTPKEGIMAEPLLGSGLVEAVGRFREFLGRQHIVGNVRYKIN